MAYKPSYGKDKNGSYKVNEDGSKTHMNSNNSQYFPSDYGGGAGWSTGGNTSTNKPSNTYTSSGSTGSSPSNQYTVPGTGGMSQQQYNAEVARKKSSGISLTGAVDMNKKNAIGKKLGYGSVAQTGTKTGTNIIGAQDGKYNHDKYEMRGSDVYKTSGLGGEAYKVDMEKNAQYIPEYIRQGDNYIKTGGTNRSYYNSDLGQSVSYDKRNTWGRHDTNASKQFGDRIQGQDGKWYLKDTEGYKQAFNENQQALVQGKSDEELQDILNNPNINPYIQDAIKEYMGAFKQDTRVDGMSPQLIGVDGQQDLTLALAYDYMSKNGIENFEGINTKEFNEILNGMGLPGVSDVNALNELYTIDQMAQKEGDYALEINKEDILKKMQEIDGFANGFEMGANGKPVPKGFNTQWGNQGMLADKGELIRQNRDIGAWFEGRTQAENNKGEYLETPLEMRAKYQPDSMNDEMKADLQMERDIKGKLEQLTLELEMLEGVGASGHVAGGYGGINGGGTYGNMGNGKSGSGATGSIGNGGDSTFEGIKGGGRSAKFGTAYSSQQDAMMNAIFKHMGGL